MIEGCRNVGHIVIESSNLNGANWANNFVVTIFSKNETYLYKLKFSLLETRKQPNFQNHLINFVIFVVFFSQNIMSVVYSCHRNRIYILKKLKILNRSRFSFLAYETLLDG